jgi:hypothetical protein
MGTPSKRAMKRLLHVSLQCALLLTPNKIGVVNSAYPTTPRDSLDDQRSPEVISSLDSELSSSSESLATTTLDMSYDTLMHILTQDTSLSSKPVDAKSLANIASILLAAQSDPESQVLLENIRVKAAEHFLNLHHFHRVTSSLDKRYVVSQLANLWNKMNAIESIIQKHEVSSNPAIVLAEMQEDDLIPEFITNRMDEVVFDDLSSEEAERRIEETRHSWYVAFLSYAAAGGYIK